MGLTYPMARQSPNVAPTVSRKRQIQTAFRSPKVLAIHRPFDVLWTNHWSYRRAAVQRIATDPPMKSCGLIRGSDLSNSAGLTSSQCESGASAKVGPVRKWGQCESGASAKVGPVRKLGAVYQASRTLRNAASQAGCAGHAGAVTRFPSTCTLSTAVST
jgi:hypothetical protein